MCSKFQKYCSSSPFETNLKVKYFQIRAYANYFVNAFRCFNEYYMYIICTLKKIIKSSDVLSRLKSRILNNFTY